MGVTPNDRSILQLTLGFAPLSCPLGVPYAAIHHGGSTVIPRKHTACRDFPCVQAQHAKTHPQWHSRGVGG